METKDDVPAEQYLASRPCSGFSCSACCLPIIGAGYNCRSCTSIIHKSCCQLPTYKTHPFHLNHSLTLLAKAENQLVSCDQCRDSCGCLYYHCDPCNFSLDIKCATLSDAQCQMLNEIHHVKAKILSSVVHDHVLSVFNCRQQDFVVGDCSVCELPLKGLAYCCMDGHKDFLVHESCARLLAQIQHPYHQHPLHFNSTFQSHSCNVCDLEIKHFGYECQRCNFRIHIRCVHASTSAIKCNGHIHKLFYFEPDDSTCVESADRSTMFRCDVCYEFCRDSFYRCFECNFNRHFQCIPIQPKVKHDHVHPLTFVKCVIFEDHKEYYCHFCETEREPQFPVYSCDQCPYTAHISCIFCEGHPEEGEALEFRRIRRYTIEEDTILPEADEDTILKVEQEIFDLKLDIANKRTILEALTEKLRELETTRTKMSMQLLHDRI